MSSVAAVTWCECRWKHGYNTAEEQKTQNQQEIEWFCQKGSKINLYIYKYLQGKNCGNWVISFTNETELEEICLDIHRHQGASH